MPAPVPAMSILALDPSTEVTGIALVQFSPEGKPRRCQWKAIDARGAARGTTLAARIARIRHTRKALAVCLSAWPWPIDLVAYERDTGRGHGSSEALKMAAGAYISLSHLAGLPILPITRQAACVASGTLFVYRQPAGPTRAEREAKRQRLKRAVIAWANESSYNAGLTEGEESEAIADALAVAQAAWMQEQARAEKAQRQRLQLRLTGPRGGKL